MQAHSILQAKIVELEEAFREAAISGNPDLQSFYNRELISHLLRLADELRGNPTPNSGTDS